jgi:hypothetical protein
MADPALSAAGATSASADAVCQLVLLDQVFVIAPGASATSGSPFDKKCTDAITVPFPALTTRAGQFQASLKLTGHASTLGVTGGEAGAASGGAATSSAAGQPGKMGGNGGAQNAGTGGATNEATSSPAICRIMPLGERNALAGTPTAIYAVVPGNWASDPTLMPCESSCFDGNDEDQDGRTDCDDPSCAEKCQACTHVVKDGRAVPDCNDPDCGCVAAAGMAGTSGGGGVSAGGGRSGAASGTTAAGDGALAGGSGQAGTTQGGAGASGQGAGGMNGAGGTSGQGGEGGDAGGNGGQGGA